MRFHRHLALFGVGILCFGGALFLSVFHLPKLEDGHLSRDSKISENLPSAPSIKNNFVPGGNRLISMRDSILPKKFRFFTLTELDQFPLSANNILSPKMHLKGISPKSSKLDNSNFMADLQFSRKFSGQNGSRDTHSESSLVYPGILNFTWDRIIPQINYTPSRFLSKEGDRRIKIILSLTGLEHGTPEGQDVFIRENCQVNDCHLNGFYPKRQAMLKQADAVIFQFDHRLKWIRPNHQIWILNMLESPMHTTSLEGLGGAINWTATYRLDSTFVTPYDKFTIFPNVTSLPERAPRNYASGKGKLVAWFVSNCYARNRRKEYVEELSRYIQVDVYGPCGNLTCSRMQEAKCFEMLKKNYKFYLSFENSNCLYYITEKFFINALRNDVIPVVMGARREDYTQVAPPESFIHVEDFQSAKELADYLHKLDQNDDLYNQYFRWKRTGEFIPTKYWCRLCAMLHDDTSVKQFDNDIEAWWRQGGTCTLDRWDNPADLVYNFTSYIEPNS